MKALSLSIKLLGVVVIIIAVSAGYDFYSSEIPRQLDDPVAELKKLSESGAIGEVQPGTLTLHSKISPHSNANPHAKLGPEKLVMVALMHHAEGRTSEALTTLNDGFKRYPDSAEILGVRGTIYLQAGRVGQALNDFESGLSLSPDDVLLLVNRAQAYRQSGREDAALKDLDKAISLNSDLVAARFNRGVIYLNKRNYEAARKDFERCILIDQQMPAPYFNLAIALDRLGRRPEAIVKMERFIAMAQQESWRKTAEMQLAKWKSSKNDAGHTEAAKDSKIPAKSNN